MKLFKKVVLISMICLVAIIEYSGAAKPPVRPSVSHQSGQAEPLSYLDVLLHTFRHRESI